MKLSNTARALVVALTLSVATPAAFAQDYSPVPGGELLDQLRSPLFLATTANTASTESVSGDVVNPATSALKQRIHVDGSYAAIVGAGQWSGHSATGGVTVPTPVGVFTSSLNYAGAEYDALNLGQRGSLHVSFAKDLYSTVLFGAGLRGHIGSGGDGIALAGGLDLGIIHLLGDRGPLQDLRWGFALTQMGNGLAASSDSTGSPAPFTPAADIQAAVVRNDSVDWTVHTGFTAPSFQNVRFRAGSSTTFFDRVSLNLGWDIDLQERTDSTRKAGSLLPSVGLSVRFQPTFGSGSDRNEMAVHGGYAPLYDDVWAAGTGVNLAVGVVDRTPPEITVDYPDTRYISPNNDGISDELLLPIHIEDERYVTGWALEVHDDQDRLVRRIENSEQRPENEGFRNIIDRLLYVKQGVAIPREIRWNGRTEDGTVAEDGAYTFVVRAHDDNENLGEAGPYTVVVDATVPETEITEPDGPDSLIFSPNDDDIKDVLALTLDTSREDSWTIQVLDVEDEVIYEEVREDTALSSFTWDGRDSRGTLVPDGVYSLRVAAEDRAGNTGSDRLNSIIVDTEPTPIALTVNIGHFSPNGDDRRDQVRVAPDIPVTDGIRSHTFRIKDASGTVVRTETGGATVPEIWTFDGRNDAGRILPEGVYRGELELSYRNGNRPTAETPELTLDLTPPRMAVSSSTPVFSPNGDGRLDSVRFLHETERAQSWEGRIIDDEGEPVRIYQWRERPEAEVEWDGRTADGARVPDGTFRYEMTGEDRAGNRRTSSPILVELDTRETPVFVSTSRTAFSPNGNGVADTIALIPDLADSRGVQRFQLELLDQSGNLVAEISDSGVPEREYRWDGRGRQGTVVPDGTYSVRLTVQYRHGNRPQAVSIPFEVDTVPPSATVTAEDTIFSPDGDGDKDSIAIDQQSTTEARWQGQIVSESGDTVVRTWDFSGALSPITWDGTGEDGSVAPDGEYRYRVAGEDAAGNRFSTATERFEIDTREVDAAVRLGSAAFSPNGDGVQDTVTIIPSISIETPVASWTASMRSTEDDSVMWEETRSGEIESLQWDGERSGGGQAADGEYRASLSVEFARGDEASVSSARSVTLDTVPPQAEVGLSSPVISPNGDGNLDELIITQTTSEEERWRARILDADGTEVGRWEWSGRAPDTLSFSGLDTARNRVSDGRYSYLLSATDTAGNRTTEGPLEFEVYTAETPLELYAGRRAFSPNSDGTLDTVSFSVTTGDARGLERYRFAVVNSDGTTVTEETGSDLPEEFIWDGTNASGQRAREDAYTAELTLEYRHGNRPHARTREVLLDVTSPEIEVSASHEIFSPDGDGRRDVVEITQTTGPAERWRAEIVDSDEEPVRSYSWTERAQSFAWDGRDAAGNTVPDGTYSYQISGIDAAGNTAEAIIPALTVDTRPTRVFVTLNRRAISPNGDGVTDELTIRTITRRTDGAERREVAVVDPAGATVRSFESETVAAQETLTWEGDTADGGAADGDYRIRYRVFYDNGAIGEATSPVFRVDTRGPELAVDLQGLPFSPDNDGLNDELLISLSAEDAGKIEEWEFVILDRNNRPFQRFDGSGQPRSELIWDGRSSDGELVISAEDYPYRFTAVDSTGNRSTEEGEIPVDILVVRDGDLLKVQISNINFAPNSPELELDQSTENGRKNISVLDRLVEVFDKYRSYEIRVEGHAVNISGTEREQEEELLPLSRSRAETVRRALVERGMDPDRITILGRGGSDPIVPHTDLDNRWKNRRVEFILIR
ncbi:MAG: FlgD immunoglobulin-like domain containing protein [Alkalispirochaeta sp.]